MKTSLKNALLGCLIFSILLSACASAAPTPTATALPKATSLLATATPIPQPTATKVLPRSLNVCMGEEPNSLYPFGTLNAAARSVLGAIYDGPIDTFTNGYQPVILQKIPSLDNGDAQVAPVDMKRGDPVVDASGKFAVLDIGVKVLPSGCTSDACAVKFDGTTALKMDQMVVTYHLLPNLKWSDGAPLKAEDSVFAFKLNSDAATPGSKFLIDRTLSYEAVDDQTVQWWGIPGFIDASYADNFWSPLPKHLWETIPAADLAKGDVSAHPPVGWGPYIFKEWSAGNYIKLEKNPAYFRASDGLPHFDTLTFLFMKDAASGISALIAGQCDVLDTSLRLDGEINLLTDLQRSAQVKLVTATTPLIERLDFGIKPSSYDDSYSPGTGDRQNMLGDVLARQGIAYCLDRQKVVDTVLGGISKVPDSFISPEHPLFNKDIAKYPFDINQGIALLDQVGWKDTDNDPSTPRVAVNVKNVTNGTKLVLNYVTTSALQRRQVSEILAKSLAQCGVGVNLQYLGQDQLYAPGPDGPLFGRKFDLAEYAIGSVGTEPPCAWFMSSQVPANENKWVGVNISGYSNADYDTQCRKALNSLPGKQDYKDAYAGVQTIFANDLPSVPLYMRIKVAATRRDMCNYSLDAFAVNDLWNIEELNYGPGCGG